MDPITLCATQSTYDQPDFFSWAVDTASFPTADHLQMPITAWTEILLLTPYKKHPYQGSKPIHSLLQLPYNDHCEDASCASVAAVAHLKEASFPFLRYGHYIQLFLVRQFRQLLDFLG
jgi:hypothetical protein